MLDDEMIVFIFVLFILFIAFVIVFNPFFWQGLRNAKFWDKQKKTKQHKDAKDIEPWTNSTC